MYTSFFKHEPQYGVFKAKKNINRGIMPQQTSQICVYTSFFKREPQYEAFKAKEIINWSRDNATTNEPDMHVYLVL